MAPNVLHQLPPQTARQRRGHALGGDRHGDGPPPPHRGQREVAQVRLIRGVQQDAERPRLLGDRLAHLAVIRGHEDEGMAGGISGAVGALQQLQALLRGEPPEGVRRLGGDHAQPGSRLEKLEGSALGDEARADEQDTLASQLEADGIVDGRGDHDVSSRGSAAHVQAALAVGRGLPPPAASALVLVGLHGARAGGAANGGVAAIVEDVVRHAVLLDVAPHLPGAPRDQGVELEEAAVIHVPLEGLYLRPGHGLLAAQPRDPRLPAAEGAPERLHLADAAALLARLDALAEGEMALGGDERLHALPVREERLHIQPVTVAQHLADLIRLGGQSAGVEGEQAHTGGMLSRQIDEHHILGPEAHRHGRARAETGLGPGENLLGGGVFQLSRCGKELFLGQHAGGGIRLRHRSSKRRKTERPTPPPERRLTGAAKMGGFCRKTGATREHSAIARGRTGGGMVRKGYRPRVGESTEAYPIKRTPPLTGRCPDAQPAGAGFRARGGLPPSDLAGCRP
ncbi:hypothetical protein STIAU_4244 [Stigmatella aurantiaca DW4/3-1]|uniref:Uncharacterized protein n=1 Tax=Stigmatella aurantiaca (strain DW4/3-1) TaxID=378806 RepID=Q08RF1_STIAD|nr:hypothetical protein STIAU_4244 [Stigmatella aurantiaca DW4/3-1]